MAQRLIRINIDRKERERRGRSLLTQSAPTLFFFKDVICFRKKNLAPYVLLPSKAPKEVRSFTGEKVKKMA